MLSLVNGAFSDRFHKIALACGLETDVLAAEWGAVHSPEALAAALKGGAYDAVTVVHSETSTGALNPIAELAKVAHAAGDVVLLVDSVSGVAGVPVESDAWGLDFVLTGSQKAFALPPGLAFGVAQPNILERAAAQRSRGIYFDFIEFEKFIAEEPDPEHAGAVAAVRARAATEADGRRDDRRRAGRGTRPWHGAPGRGRTR